MSAEAKMVSDTSACYSATAEARNVPPGYQRTEVGVIPADWHVKRLGTFASFRTGPFGSALHKADYIVGGIPLINPMHIAGGQLIPDSATSVSKDAAARLAVFRLRPHDIVIGRRGEMGRCAVAQQAHSGWLCGTGSLIIRCSGQADPVFLQRVLTTQRVIASIEDASVGSTMINLNQAALSGLQIPLPALTEQCAIAEALSDVDGLLGALEALIAKKRAIKQAAMQQLLTGKTRLPGFSGAWKKKRLGDIATFHKGSGVSKADLTPDGKTRCIHYGELFTTYGERIAEVLNGTEREGSFFRSVSNDVLMPTSDVTPNGLATASCILLSGIILGGDILVVRAADQLLNGEFLAYAVQVYRKQVMQLVSGTTVFHLYGRDMTNFRFPAPSVQEQTAITAALSDMDAEIVALVARRDKIRAIKQGMMQQLLTGRTRLVPSQPEPAVA